MFGTPDRYPVTPIHLIIIGAFVHALTITTGLALTAYGVWAMTTHRRTP